MRPMHVLTMLALTANAAAADLIVDCDRGQSLSRALSFLPKNVPATVAVKGTCTEYVTIAGFEGLTVKSSTGAVIQQPAEPSADPDGQAALIIAASRSVTVEGLRIRPNNSAASLGVVVADGSVDVRFRRVKVEGGVSGVFVIASQVRLEHVGVRDARWAAVALFDNSFGYFDGCLMELRTAEEGWHVGIFAATSVAQIHGTTIRNMQVGIQATDRGHFGIGGPGDVVVENPLGTNFYGVVIDHGSTATVSDAKLRIVNAGQPWGDATGGVFVDIGSSAWLNGLPNGASGVLEVIGSQGQGVTVSNNSYVSIVGATVTGSAHANLVVFNNSTAALSSYGSWFADLGGAAGVDVFCDPTSLVTGANSATFVTQDCGSVLGGGSVVLP